MPRLGLAAKLVGKKLSKRKSPFLPDLSVRGANEIPVVLCRLQAHFTSEVTTVWQHASQPADDGAQVLGTREAFSRGGEE